MKILLFGKNGQVGWELNRSLLPLGEIIALGRDGADLSRPEELRTIVREVRPDVIVNAAAYTAVDKAEDEEELALLVNGESPKVLAEEALRMKALLVHYSTDYVFDGAGKSPYAEMDKPNPISAYGRTKYAGEKAVQSSGCDYLIFRTSWVYASRGHNFLLTILNLAKERDELSVVADQMGSPTSAALIAGVTSHCIFRAARERKTSAFNSDLYHLSSSGCASWNEFAKEIVEMAGSRFCLKLASRNIKAVTTSEYPTAASRPMNSKLAIEKLQKKFNLVMPDWKVPLKLYIAELNKNL